MSEIEIVDTNANNIHDYGFCGYNNAGHNNAVGK